VTDTSRCPAATASLSHPSSSRGTLAGTPPRREGGRRYGLAYRPPPPRGGGPASGGWKSCGLDQHRSGNVAYQHSLTPLGSPSWLLLRNRPSGDRGARARSCPRCSSNPPRRSPRGSPVRQHTAEESQDVNAGDGVGGGWVIDGGNGKATDWPTPPLPLVRGTGEGHRSIDADDHNTWAGGECGCRWGMGMHWAGVRGVRGQAWQRGDLPPSIWDPTKRVSQREAMAKGRPPPPTPPCGTHTTYHAKGRRRAVVRMTPEEQFALAASRYGVAPGGRLCRGPAGPTCGPTFTLPRTRSSSWRVTPPHPRLHRNPI